MACQTQVADSQSIEEVEIPVLLPHEILHSVVHAGPDQVRGKIFSACTHLTNRSLHVYTCMRMLFPINQIPITLRQISKSLLGDWSRKEIASFWEHLVKCDEWSSHPVLNDEAIDKGSLLSSAW